VRTPVRIRVKSEIFTDIHTFAHCAQLGIRVKVSVVALQKTKKRANNRPMTITEVARMGGKATARKLTPKQRKESARKAARARWKKGKGKS